MLMEDELLFTVLEIIGACFPPRFKMLDIKPYQGITGPTYHIEKFRT